MDLLKKWLINAGIEDITKASEEEQATYFKYKKTLTEGELTVDKIKEFCQDEKIHIEKQWQNLENSTQKNERLIIIHTIYSRLLEVIEAPKKEKEIAEKYLQELIDK